MARRSQRGHKHLLSGGLFQRLERQEDAYEGDAPYTNHIDALVGSIKEHLNWMLNTHTGASPSAMKVGLDDFNGAQVNSSNMKKEISDNIKKTIETYEPRIKNVEATLIPNQHDPLTIRVVISGDVHFANQSERIEFDLRFEKGKRCRIR